MENRSRAINLVFVGCGAFAAALVLYVLRWLSPMFALEAKIPAFDFVVSLTALIVGVGTWFFVSQHPKVKVFLGEVVAETMKTSFPEKKEVYAATIVVTIFVLIIGFILGGFDSFISWILKQVLST